MSFDDPHSFLFGLNQFATPSNNNSPQASGSLNMNRNASESGQQQEQQQRDNSLLNGLDAFGGGAGSNNDILDGGSFADQLELWTNANFSFDGPTGHALLGDEDKEKGEGDKKDEDKDEDKRAGKRARNEGGNNAASGGRGKGRQRDEEENEVKTPVPNEPTHQTHKDQAALQQQQHYFAPPSRNAEEARRPGYDQPFAASGQPTSTERARSMSNNGARPNVPVSSAALGLASPTFGQQGNAFANGAFAGAFNGQQQPVNGVGPPQTPNGFLGGQPGGQLDLTSLLALQQLVSQNPLALASLGSFAGLNPQLGALGAQLNGLGALNGHNLQQLQQQFQQQQQHQQQQQQQNGSTQASPMIQNSLNQQPFGQFNLGYQNGWPLLNNSFNSSAPIGSMAAQVPAPSVPMTNGNGHRDSNAIMTAAGAPDDDEEKRQKGRKKRQSSAGGSDGLGDKAKSSLRERKQSFSDEELSSESGGNSRMTPAERRRMLEERAAERDAIPPLKLIDTGNPEADAEANRLAIEEDKRKRNTAASARFRVKKKQREAALEARSKELSTQLSDLRDEVSKLRTENQWLKGLIQVRPGNKDGALPASKNGVVGQTGISASEALQAAEQLQALQQAVKITQQKPLRSDPGNHLDRLRDSGIRPRGVGTESEAINKRDREE